MLRDPVTGDWDFDGFFQATIIVGIICTILSLGAISEGHSAVEPYYRVYLLAIEYSHITIASFMVGLMALWWYEQFRGGYF